MSGLRNDGMKYTSEYINDLTKGQNSCPKLETVAGSKILITGATGLVCSAIVDFLLNYNDTHGAHVTVYIAARSFEKAEKRFGQRMQRPDVVFVEYDALQSIAWDFNVDYVIHGASPANPALYVSQPVETMLANILGLNNILNYAKEHKTNRVLFVSSSEVYGKKESPEPYVENEYGFVDVLNPRACYPDAKRACETLCVSYSKEYKVETVIARLGHVYGPTATENDNRASSYFLHAAASGNNIVMKSAGNQLRSYCYVVDCASAIITILLNGEDCNAYNVANVNSDITIRQLAECIAQTGHVSLCFENPSDRELSSYNLMDNSCLNANKLEALGWKAMFDANEGVDHSIGVIKELCKQ